MSVPSAAAERSADRPGQCSRAIQGRPKHLRGLPLLLLVWTSWGCQRAAEAPRPFEERVAVRAVEVTAGEFSSRIRLLGRVRAAEELVLVAPGTGHLRHPERFRGGLATGAGVRRGEVLFEIENDDLEAQERDAELARQEAESELEITRRGVEDGFVPSIDLTRKQLALERASERLRAARERIGALTVVAEFSGRLLVDGAPRAEGSLLTGGTELARLVSDRDLLVEADATAQQAREIRHGARTEVVGDLSDSAELLATGRVSEISPAVDTWGLRRVLSSVASGTNPPTLGTSVELHVLGEARSGVLTVPATSLRVDGDISSVFVLEVAGAGHRARERFVETGLRSGSRVEVVEGVFAGDLVVTRGLEFLRDGSLVAYREERPSTDPTGSRATTVEAIP